MHIKVKFLQRKAVSTIVGGMIFLIIMVGTFTAIITAFELQKSLTETQINVATNEIGKIQEEFSASADVRNNRLTLNVTNSGSVPLEVVDLFMINQSQSDAGIKFVEINYDDGLVPVGYNANILNGETTGIKDGTYDLKVVSSRGNIQIIEDFIVSNGGLGGSDCKVKAFVVPPNIANAGNATVIGHVFNQGTRTLYDVQPNGNPTVTPSTAVLGVTLTTPSSVNELKAGESFLFAWNYELTGAVGSTVKFDVNAKAKSSSSSSTFDVICTTGTTKTKIVKATEDEILQQEITAKPEIFAVVAGPIGESENDDSRMFFGVTVVNPTNQTMTVNRVGIGFVTTEDEGNDDIFDDGETAITHVLPTNNGRCVGCTNPPGGTAKGAWTIPEDNALLWTASPIESPISIPPFSAEQFVIKGKVDDLDDDILVVMTINAYTSFGQFAKSGYMTHGDEDQNDVTIVNVYPTARSVTGNTAHTHADDLEFDAVASIKGGTTHNFNVTVREGQDSSGGGNGCPTGSDCPYVAQNEASLIINLPVGFPLVSAASGQTGFGTPTIKTFQDGSQQIVAPIGSASNTRLGDVTTDAERFTFVFSATAPNVDETRMYVVYSLLSGNDRYDFPLGAISEAYVIIVTP